MQTKEKFLLATVKLVEHTFLLLLAGTEMLISAPKIITFLPNPPLEQW